MAKGYYITVADKGGDIGPMLPGTYLGKIPHRASIAEEDVNIDKGRKDPLSGFAIFERRSHARKALALLQAEPFSPVTTYRIREIGSTQRDCSREVNGWALVYDKITFSAFNHFEEGSLSGAVAEDFEKHTFDLLGKKRYVDFEITGGDGAAGTYLSILAILSRAEEAPNSASEHGAVVYGTF